MNSLHAQYTVYYYSNGAICCMVYVLTIYMSIYKCLTRVLLFTPQNIIKVVSYLYIHVLFTVHNISEMCI